MTTHERYIEAMAAAERAIETMRGALFELRCEVVRLEEECRQARAMCSVLDRELALALEIKSGAGGDEE